MKYTLFSAVDTRDNKPMLWLLGHNSAQVALFDHKTAPSRIKRNSLSPDSIVWTCRTAWTTHADATTAKIIDSWEVPE